MPLQSKLFAGDAKLEACLVSDPAHVLPGAVGSHVQKIQTALITLDQAVINAAETSAFRYGQDTASAVQSFKKKRKIINYAYQQSADNIVGKMTIAALDKEMFAFEIKSPANSKLFECSYGIETKSQYAADPDDFMLAATGAIPPSPLAEGRLRKQDALIWIHAAQSYIESARSTLAAEADPNPQLLAMTDVGKALSTHFRFFFHPNPIPYLDRLMVTYSRMRNVVEQFDRYFSEDLVYKKGMARAVAGGINYPDERIRFCRSYCGMGRMFQTAIIIHEVSHYVDYLILHVASELPKWRGKPVDSSTDYASMTWTQASENAYSYAQFALHAFKKEDYRFSSSKE